MEQEAIIEEGSRFSGAFWYSEKKPIMLIGVGGIGSWLALNLSRIGHSPIYIFDDDHVDQTNVKGGQLYATNQIGEAKVDAVVQTCINYGGGYEIEPFSQKYDELMGMTNICITGLDNMTARKQVYDAWSKRMKKKDYSKDGILIDGRLTMESFEILAVQGDKPETWKEYEDKYLFSDEESAILDCTTKQSTFAAMGIASFMTATLCNFLSNVKQGYVIREVPFYQRVFFPIMDYVVSQATISEKEAIVESTPVLTEQVV